MITRNMLTFSTHLCGLLIDVCLVLTGPTSIDLRSYSSKESTWLKISLDFELGLAIGTTCLLHHPMMHKNYSIYFPRQ
jgi:hypothetical protein